MLPVWDVRGNEVRVEVTCDKRGSDMWFVRRFDALDRDRTRSLCIQSMTRMSAPLQDAVRRFLRETRGLRRLEIPERFLHLVVGEVAVCELVCRNRNMTRRSRTYMHVDWENVPDEWRFPSSLQSIQFKNDYLSHPFAIDRFFARVPEHLESVHVDVHQRRQMAAVIAACPCPRLSLAVGVYASDDVSDVIADARRAILASDRLTHVSIMTRHPSLRTTLELPPDVIQHLDANEERAEAAYVLK